MLVSAGGDQIGKSENEAGLSRATCSGPLKRGKRGREKEKHHSEES